MTQTQNDLKAQIVSYWIEKSQEALASARAEEVSHRFVFAVNRAYYACFYAASAVLLLQGEKFVKHSGVRAALHKKLIKTGMLELRACQVFS